VYWPASKVVPVCAPDFFALAAVIFAATRIELVKAAALLRLCSTLHKALFFTDRLANTAQLIRVLRAAPRLQ
jgi:hypothetical protein